jgi:hypothetical protein
LPATLHPGGTRTGWSPVLQATERRCQSFLFEACKKIVRKMFECSTVPCPGGGVPQWTSPQPREQKTRVQIPPGHKVFRQIISVLLCTVDSICIVCVPKKKINGGIGPKIYFLNVRLSARLRHRRRQKTSRRRL